MDLPVINAALSAGTDVTGARRLEVNARSGACYQGQTHGHKGFLLDGLEVGTLLRDARARPFLHPYLTADEMIGNQGSQPGRWVIDLNGADDLFSAMNAGAAFERLRREVEPEMRAKAEAERASSGSERGPRQSHYERWWKHWRGRGELIERIGTLPRYVAVGQVTKRPIFEMIASEIRPNAALIVFPLPDDYSFGVLQSSMHWEWVKARSSTMKGDYRYTSDTVFDSFPWPQSPTPQQVRAVADAAVALRQLRRTVMAAQGWSLRDLYRTLDTPGRNPLRDAQATLDAAVRAAYGMPQDADVLAFLLALNADVAAAEGRGDAVTGPGLPAGLNAAEFTTTDAVRPLGAGQA